MKPEGVAGVCGAILIATLICLGILARYWKNGSTNTKKTPIYSLIKSQDCGDTSRGMRTISVKTTDQDIGSKLASVWGPSTLEQTKSTAVIGWAWNTLLTLIPMCFLALAIVAVDLDGQTRSLYGERVLELTRLSPSLYPILFAAIAGRFYKNLARWYLEQPGGVRLAVLEQLFGSQSFATAFERVFLVHTHVFLSVLILATWALSPLGGQSSSRILLFGNATEVPNGAVSYLHPAYQVSSYVTRSSFLSNKGSVAAIYSSSLLSSLEQKRFPRDMWELPKIPQLKEDKKVGETYLVDLDALEKGHDHYASLLGIKLHGLYSSQNRTQYNLTAETSYIRLQCSLADDQFNITPIFDRAVIRTLTEKDIMGAIIDIENPLSQKEWKGLESPPPLQLLYFIKWQLQDEDGYPLSAWSAINCTMGTIWLATDIHCGPTSSPTSCYAYQQRQVKGKISSNHLPRLMTKNLDRFRQAVSFWPQASGDLGVGKPSATENYILGERHPYAGQDFRNWTAMDRSIFPEEISSRLTTAFNTFWDATLNPLGHTNVTFSAMDGNITTFEDEFNPEPFLNLTAATMTTTLEVYRASQFWVAILLATTLFLQILAILGVVLEALIIGPGILGFASSLT
ncbi:Ff.00g021320.m01.CDS01 [Fusarium sp. VM40]|nr:Ff.00g021320.m01.CDS01 [Fusarium sp. VM40]